MTLRGCYRTMFDTNNSSTASEPLGSTCKKRYHDLSCLSEATFNEEMCWCYGDHCNSIQASIPPMILIFLCALSILFL
ncbi:unnamed protein product [Gongylonema pulchrum]|uniref:Activin_recp domain-containing protein n=1 Tax=Gongylonema pulchrum TaxID=637853 RepID=A0A183DZI1_9BILA|nr:unnamed protein product [Gongylonema pulchrum]